MNGGLLRNQADEKQCVIFSGVAELDVQLSAVETSLGM